MKPILTFLAALCLAAPVFAHGFTAGDLEIKHPHIPQPAASAKAAGGFMTITNNGTEPDRLIGIESTIAAKSEVHESKVDANGVGTMTHIDAIEIPPGGSVTLEHGGLHVMFMGLSAPLTEGDLHKATLIFEKAGRVEVEFSVDAPTGQGDGHDHSTMDHSSMEHSKMDHSGMAHGDHSAMAPVMTGDPLVDIEALLKAQLTRRKTR
ncbi:MAG: copper chaperone PCu(A)C [Rhodobacteraceae bacterium]|nr:copper chaperone PCu(A)C [Paracoccaceae bacterium]